MPRYFFHVYDQLELRDDEGIEFADADAARDAAVAGAREMICDQVRLGRLDLRSHIEVEDENGAPVQSLSFADAITMAD